MELTQDKVKELFEYRDGALFWNLDIGFRIKKGTLAGTEKPNGYKRVIYKGKQHYIHRLIFLMFHGYMPKFIDHIDMNPKNNNIENLRASDNSTNQFNKKLSNKNKSGYKNVNWHKMSNKWVVQLSLFNKKKHIGSFEDLELAELVAIEARNKFHKEFANHGY